MNILLITPPLVQLNCPYPATTQLKAYVESVTSDKVEQKDMSIELTERIFCREFLAPLFEEAFLRDKLSTKAKAVAMNKEKYLFTVDAVMRFLRGEDNTIAARIAEGDFLPRGERFNKVDDEDMSWAFGTVGIGDKAKHYASLYLTDIADFISDMVSNSFSLIRYGEQLALSAPKFDNMKRAVDKEANIIDIEMFNLLHNYIEECKPQVVGFTVPFPGTLLGALKCGEYIKKNYPQIKIAIGGGYINTELRTITDPAIFEYIDYLLYDDGELPLTSLISFLKGEIAIHEVIRCKYLKDGVITNSLKWSENVRFEALPAPTYKGLPLDKYISMIELTNPMHKLWSDGRWNKLTVAHGCYWAKCTFCDTELDYIGRYDAPTAVTVVDRMESIIRETGQSGFHFTDEALPPKLLIEIAQEILRRKLVVSYWGNIRFEKTFTREVCELLFESGCIAVSGGLEVASNRILKMINKGVTVEGAAAVAHYMTSSGIMVHTYLMYGFPTQTMQETIDSLDIVRQMFEEGLIQSAFWHCYTMTIHSKTGCCPAEFNAVRKNCELAPFANNGVAHSSETDITDYRRLGDILYRATYNYMHGNGYDIPLKNWFESKTVRPTIAPNFIINIIDKLD